MELRKFIFHFTKMWNFMCIISSWICGNETSSLFLWKIQFVNESDCTTVSCYEPFTYFSPREGHADKLLWSKPAPWCLICTCWWKFLVWQGSALFKNCSEVTCKWKYDNPESKRSCSAPGISIGGSKPPRVLNDKINSSMSSNGTVENWITRVNYKIFLT